MLTVKYKIRFLNLLTSLTCVALEKIIWIKNSKGLKSIQIISKKNIRIQINSRWIQK